MVRSKRVWGVVVACIVLSLGAGIFIPFRPIAWHCSHRSTVDVGQYGIRLPLWWWPSGYEGNEVTILHAGFFQYSTGEIRIYPAKDLAARSERSDGVKWQGSFLEMLHGEGRKSFTPATINSRDASLFCVDKTDIPDYRLLICRIPGVAWGISFGGAASDEQSAEGVLSSLYLRKK